MSVIHLKPAGEAFEAKALSQEEADLLAKAGPERADKVARLARDVSWINVAAFLGSVAITTATAIGLAVFINRWEPMPPEFILVPEETRIPRMPVKSVDAPTLFTDDTSRFYLRQLVERCESFDFVVAKPTANQCALMMEPALQTQYEKHFSPYNSASLQNVYGRDGRVWVDLENIDYQKQLVSQFNYESWVPYFDRHEVKEGRRACAPWRLAVVFTWRPDLAMEPKDRPFNLAGFQARKYEGGQDRLRSGCKRGAAS